MEQFNRDKKLLQYIIKALDNLFDLGFKIIRDKNVILLKFCELNGSKVLEELQNHSDDDLV